MCPICEKHRGRGPLVGELVVEDDVVLVYHRPPDPTGTDAGADTDDAGTAVLGYLFVETRRHVPAIHELTEDEAVAVARAVWRLSRGLRAELDAEFVFSAVIGTGVPHFHQHVLARHPGTPADLPWTEIHSWPEAPRGDAARIADLCARLRRHF